jgi:hypothetical protein
MHTKRHGAIARLLLNFKGLDYQTQWVRQIQLNQARKDNC